MTPALEFVVYIAGIFLTTAVVVNTGLLWRIALKVGNVEGKMSYVYSKMVEHNDLVARVVALEVKEEFYEARREDRRTVEQDGDSAPE